MCAGHTSRLLLAHTPQMPVCLHTRVHTHLHACLHVQLLRSTSSAARARDPPAACSPTPHPGTHVFAHTCACTSPTRAAAMQQCSNAAAMQQCSSNAATQQCSSNAAAMQQQCSSAAAPQQCSNAAATQQCSSNAAAMQQCSNAAAMQPSQCFQASCRLLPPHSCTLTSVLSHHGSSHARAKPGLGGGLQVGGMGAVAGCFLGGGGFASATVTASLIFVASEKWGRAVVSPREPAAHDGRPPLLL